MEYQHCIFFSDYKDLTLLHLLAEGHSFGEFEGVALYPFALGGGLLLLISLDFVEGDEVELVIEGIVENKFVPLDVS